MDVLLPLGFAAGVALAVFLLVLLLRAIANGLAWLFTRRDAPVLSSKLGEYLASTKVDDTLAGQLDRTFERMVGRGPFNLTAAQGIASLLLVAASVGALVYIVRSDESLAFSAAMVATAITLIVYWFTHRRWQTRLREQLPDAFHLMARSLRAGLTVDQSIALLAEQGSQPLATEFKRTTDTLRLGATVPAALDRTAQRVGLPDFDLFASLVGLHRESGGNLALLVDRLANAVRSRNHFRGHAVAVTALGRLTGLVLASAPFVLLTFYWFAYPDYFTRLVGTSAGLTALAIAMALEAIGVVWLLWLLRIEY
jgi:tight adherence protein B